MSEEDIEDAMSILVSALIDVVEVGLSSRRCRASLFG
jgi:hypothetical protein